MSIVNFTCQYPPSELGLDYFSGRCDKRAKVGDDLGYRFPTSQGLMTTWASEHDGRAGNCEISCDVAFLARDPVLGRKFDEAFLKAHTLTSHCLHRLNRTFQ